MTTGSFCLNLLFFSFRFKMLCISSMLISLSLTTFRNFLHRKKQQNQIAVGTERPSSVVAIVDLPFNVVSENDQMISFKTVVIFSSVLISFFMIWMYYSSKAGSVYYNLMICFSLVLNITPPLYFFNNLSSFKIAVSLVGEMFN
jgi:hypothetical protein